MIQMISKINAGTCLSEIKTKKIQHQMEGSFQSVLLSIQTEYLQWKSRLVSPRNLRQDMKKQKRESSSVAKVVGTTGTHCRKMQPQVKIMGKVYPWISISEMVESLDLPPTCVFSYKLLDWNSGPWILMRFVSTPLTWRNIQITLFLKV